MKFFNSLTLLLTTLLTEQVYSHVTANPREAPEASYFVAYFRVPHGCSGSPTTQVYIEWDPELIKSGTTFSPQYIPGWKTTNMLVEEKAANSTEALGDSHASEAGGGEVKTRGVIYSGGEIPGDQFADFGVSFKLPAIKELPKESNGTLYFPVSQFCVNKQWANWTKKGDAKFPPPQIVLKPIDSKLVDGKSNSTSPAGGKSDAKALLTASSAILFASAFAFLSL